LWQYKTFISARLPRYKDEKGFYHTVDILSLTSIFKAKDIVNGKDNILGAIYKSKWGGDVKSMLL